MSREAISNQRETSSFLNGRRTRALAEASEARESVCLEKKSFHAFFSFIEVKIVTDPRQQREPFYSGLIGVEFPRMDVKHKRPASAPYRFSKNPAGETKREQPEIASTCNWEIAAHEPNGRQGDFQ